MTGKFDLANVNNTAFCISGTKTFIWDNRNFDSSEFDSTGVKLYIFIHNEVRDFDKNSTQPEIRVNRVRDNESQLWLYFGWLLPVELQLRHGLLNWKQIFQVSQKKYIFHSFRDVLGFIIIKTYIDEYSYILDDYFL